MYTHRMMLHILLVFAMTSSCLSKSFNITKSVRFAQEVEYAPDDHIASDDHIAPNTHTAPDFHSAPSAQFSVFNAFGCEYKDARYSLDTKWTSHWPNNPIYSTPRDQLIHFKTEEEFEKFYKTVDAIVQDELQSMTFNNIELFLAMFRSFKDFQYAHKKSSFSRFFKEYIPTYPPVAGDDDITALLRIYHKIILEDSKVKSAFVMATKDADVQKQQVDKYFSKKNGSRHCEPMNDFQHKGVVGIINFGIGNKHAGYIIIDLLEPKYPTPIVMEDENHKLNTEDISLYYILSDNQTIRSKFEVSPDYLAINHYMTYSINSANNEGQNVITNEAFRRDLIYKYKSLCSFIQTTEKARSLYSLLYLFKYNKDRKYHASIEADLLNDRIMMSCPNGINLRPTFSLTNIFNKDLSEDIKKLMGCVEDNLGLKSGYLRAALYQLYKAMKYPNFKVSFTNMEKQVFTSVSKKGLIKSALKSLPKNLC